MSLVTFAGPDELAAQVARRIEERLRHLQADGGMPSVVLTGGTIAGLIYAQFKPGVVDWERIRFFWGDERFVPAGHSDRNDRQARETFLNRLGVPAHNVLAMPVHDGALSAADAADHYAGSLPGGDFDLVLLGMGPDGHIASLFPSRGDLDEQSRAVIEVLDSPKPPPVRISLSLPRLNAATSVWFLVSGADKAEAVARAHGGASMREVPAAGVSGHDETIWFLDDPAASLVE